MTEWTSTEKASSIITPLTKAGIPASPINTVTDMVGDPNIDYGGTILEVEQPKIGEVGIANTPLGFSLAPRGAKIEPTPF